MTNSRARTTKTIPNTYTQRGVLVVGPRPAPPSMSPPVSPLESGYRGKSAVCLYCSLVTTTVGVS